MEKQKWSYNGVELNTKAWNVINIAEGIGTPGYRGNNIQIPFQHGKRWIKKRFNERKIMLPMWVKGLDPITGKIPDGKSLAITLDENIDYLTSVFGKEGQYTLRRTLYNGTIREASAEVYGPVSFVKKLPGYAVYSVEFLLSDPFFYSISKDTQTNSITSTSVEWTHKNSGTAPVLNAVITLTGPMDSPKLECVNIGIWLQYLGIISSGESVIINTGDFSCQKEGTNMISAIKHGGDSYLFILEAGYNDLILSNNATGGNVKIEYYPAFF
ncbi:Phage tail protein [anaerobic digester metagenome]